jgi:hypothetical protein
MPRVLAAVVVAALLSGLAAAVPSAASATSADPSALVLTTYEDPDLPHFVPTGDDWEPISFRVAATEDAANVTLTVQGEGLAFDQDSYSLGDLSAGDSRSNYVEVTATPPGFHALTFTVIADGVPPVTETLSRLWAPGGAPLPGGGDLSGRGYGWSGFVSGVVGESSSRVTTMVSFVDDTHAYVGLPRRGLTCPSQRCAPYYYDEITGLVQIGDRLVGQVLGPRLYLEGLTPSDPETPDFRTGALLTDAVGAPDRARYSGTWRYSTRSYPDGLVYQRLVLDRNGGFDLAFRYDNDSNRRLSGSYRLGPEGSVAFRSGRTHKVLHGTLLVREDPDGTQRPGTRGIWLMLDLRRGSGVVVDGNRMRPS